MYRLFINPRIKKGHINSELQGHFSEHLGRCIYEGIYVGEDSSIPNTNGMRNDVVEALKAIKIPVLRWPGGCFADEYHWKDGIGPKESRKRMINTHWGGVVEDNSFGTHEYMELCRQLGCKTYVNGNMGSGTVQEMSEWVEYMTFKGVSPMADWRKQNGHEDAWKVDYFGVGNENWGCGGNMLPEYYANEYRRYQTYVRNYSDEHICKIACGPSDSNYEWTDTVLKQTHRGDNGQHCFMDGLSLHYYTMPDGWDGKKTATDFDEAQWYRTLNKTLFMDEIITRHSAIMDGYDREKKIGLIVDEWGTWFACEEGTNPGFLYQQNTMRDALVAGINLNIFNKHCDRVKMANIAQMVNVLQAVLLTDGDSLVKTPTYHVFDMYKCHQNAELVESYLETKMIGTCDSDMVPNLTESVSIGEDGKLNITINNLSVTEDYQVAVDLTDVCVKSVKGEILTGEMHECNTFDNPNQVKIQSFDKYLYQDQSMELVCPACSVIHLEVTI